MSLLLHLGFHLFPPSLIFLVETTALAACFLFLSFSFGLSLSSLYSLTAVPILILN